MTEGGKAERPSPPIRSPDAVVEPHRLAFVAPRVESRPHEPRGEAVRIFPEHPGADARGPVRQRMIHRLIGCA